MVVTAFRELLAQKAGRERERERESERVLKIIGWNLFQLPGTNYADNVKLSGNCSDSG